MYHYVVMMMIGASVAGATSWGVYTAVSGSAALRPQPVKFGSASPRASIGEG